jgi:hypothetical protein
MFFGTPTSSVKYNFLYSGLNFSYLLYRKQAWTKITIYNQKKKLKVNFKFPSASGHHHLDCLFLFLHTLDIVSFREKCSYFLLLCMVERNSLLDVLSKWQTGRFLHHCTSQLQPLRLPLVWHIELWSFFLEAFTLLARRCSIIIKEYTIYIVQILDRL